MESLRDGIICGEGDSKPLGLSRAELSANADPFVCVRQRAGPLAKALVTDNYGYLRRYGPGAVRGRCGPALSRTTVDKLELRLALFGYDGIFTR